MRSTRETEREQELKLPGQLFVRVHKSYLVALDKIESIERDRIRIQTSLIPISDTYREKFYGLISGGSR
jgi:DNA-binding LytR/AlgR family response regulator